ncbi:hypothetical protein ACFYWS_11985 [Streptomyces sp. NPDC002795]|uniref:hypothetical protein n=1 Tax=Streptomyces sp. NPDC002795 TaxID=3364665 RepID=UPI00368844FB
MPTSSRKGTTKAAGDRDQGREGEGRFGPPIADEASFDALTSDPGQAAALYFYLHMDHVVCAAHRVAIAAVERPQMFTRLREKGSASDLARLRARYGHDERVPDRAQRTAVYLGAFQETASRPVRDAGGFSFPQERDALLDACCKYAERVYDTGVDLLLASVRNAHVTLQSYLAGLHGDSLVWSVEETLGGIARQLSYPLLHDAGINAAFGITTPPHPDWPFREDANADKLLEEIDRQFPLPAVAGQEAPAPLTRAGSSNRQRTAIRGAEAIAAVLRFPPNGPADQLIDMTSKCYLWATALRSLTPPPVASPGPQYAG